MRVQNYGISQKPKSIISLVFGKERENKPLAFLAMAKKCEKKRAYYWSINDTHSMPDSAHEMALWTGSSAWLEQWSYTAFFTKSWQKSMSRCLQQHIDTSIV